MDKFVQVAKWQNPLSFLSQQLQNKHNRTMSSVASLTNVLMKISNKQDIRITLLSLESKLRACHLELTDEKHSLFLLLKKEKLHDLTDEQAYRIDSWQ